jgi:hypothetical protein
LPPYKYVVSKNDNLCWKVGGKLEPLEHISHGEGAEEKDHREEKDVGHVVAGLALQNAICSERKRTQEIFI